MVRPALLDRTGLQGRQKPGLEVGQDPAHRPGAPTRRASPATGWCCRWQHCWPWPMAPGWKTPMTAGLLQATYARRPKPAPYWIRGRRLPGAATPGAGRYGPSASSATASTGCGVCCSGAASGAGSGCCPNPGRNPNQPWRSPTMPLRDNTIHTPVRGAAPSHRPSERRAPGNRVGGRQSVGHGARTPFVIGLVARHRRIRSGPTGPDR